MTPLFFKDEVFLDCSKDLNSSDCTFTFKGKEIYLKHTLDIKTEQHAHRLIYKVDSETFNFEVGHSTLNSDTFDNWPRINFKGKLYRFKIIWSMTDGEKGIRLEMEDDPQLLAEHREALAEKMKQERSHASIMEYMTSHPLSRGEKQIDTPNKDIEKSTDFTFLSPTLKKQWSEETRKHQQEKEVNKPKSQEELDDEQGFLHIHTLPPERRKQIIEQLKNKKK